MISIRLDDATTGQSGEILTHNSMYVYYDFICYMFRILYSALFKVCHAFCTLCPKVIQTQSVLNQSNKKHPFSRLGTTRKTTPFSLPCTPILPAPYVIIKLFVFVCQSTIIDPQHSNSRHR